MSSHRSVTSVSTSENNDVSVAGQGPVAERWSGQYTPSRRSRFLAKECQAKTFRACGTKFCLNHYKWRTPSFSISGRHFDVIRGLLVYVWIRRGTVLYVGMSKNGMRRLILPHEHVKELLPTDRIELYPFTDAATAERFERRLIRSMRLDFNKLWNPDHPEWANGFRGHKKHAEAAGGQRVPHFRSTYWRTPKTTPPPAADGSVA